MKNRNENEDYLKFVALIKAILLDKTNAQSVNDFNDVLQKLTELTTSVKKKKRTTEDVNKILSDFKTKLPTLKVKIRNFKKA